MFIFSLWRKHWTFLDHFIHFLSSKCTIYYPFLSCFCIKQFGKHGFFYYLVIIPMGGNFLSHSVSHIKVTILLIIWHLSTINQLNCRDFLFEKESLIHDSIEKQQKIKSNLASTSWFIYLSTCTMIWVSYWIFVWRSFKKCWGSVSLEHLIKKKSHVICCQPGTTYT